MGAVRIERDGPVLRVEDLIVAGVLQK